MSWNFRRTAKIGPIRINASKSGVGGSIGTRGLRVGKDAKGRTYTAASIPRTGIYRRDYLKKSHQQTSASALAGTPKNPSAARGAAPPGLHGSPTGIHKSPGSSWLLYFGAAILLAILVRMLF